MSWSRVNGNIAGNASATGATGVTVGMGTVNAGDVIHVIVRRSGTGVTFTVADGIGGNTYTSLQATSSGDQTEFYRCIVTNGGTCNITVTHGGGTARLGIGAVVHRTDAGPASGDGSNKGTGTGTSADSGAVTTTGADCLMAGLAGATTPSASVGSGWGNFSENATARIAIEDRIEASTGTFNGTFTLASQSWHAYIGAAKETGGGGGGSTHPGWFHSRGGWF